MIANEIFTYRIFYISYFDGTYVISWTHWLREDENIYCANYINYSQKWNPFSTSSMFPIAVVVNFMNEIPSKLKLLSNGPNLPKLSSFEKGFKLRLKKSHAGLDYIFYICVGTSFFCEHLSFLECTKKNVQRLQWSIRKSIS